MLEMQSNERGKSGSMRSSYFDGTLLGFIGNRLLAWLLTIITLGIAAPWAVCMRKQWELEHTVVNNHRMKFTGNAAEAIGTWILYLICSYLALGAAAFLCNSLGDISREAQIAGCVATLVCFLLYVPFTKIHIMKWIAKYTVFDSRGARSIGPDGKPVPGTDTVPEISQPQRAEAPAYATAPVQTVHLSGDSILDTPLFLVGAAILAAAGVCAFIFTAHIVPGLVVTAIGIGLLIVFYVHQ